MFRIVWIMAIMISSSVAGVMAQEPPPAKVVVAEITRQQVADNSGFLGLLYYDRVSRVSSEVAGLVREIEVRAGDRVKKGAPLVRLDTELLDQAIIGARIRVEQMDLRIRFAEKSFRRLEKLFAKDGVSEKSFDDAQYAYQDALVEKRTAEQSLSTLLIRKRKSVIAAPFAGVVLEKQVDSGDWVQQGKELVSLGSTDDLFVRVPVAETLLRFVQPGETVTVELKASGQEVVGTVDAIEPRADAQTKNVFLRVRIPSVERVAENMSALVFIPTSDKRELSMIPRDALIKFQGKDFVYTVKEGKAAILPVNIVTYQGNMIGADNPYFAVGMAVVIEGNERLRPDQSVVVDK